MVGRTAQRSALLGGGVEEGARGGLRHDLRAAADQSEIDQLGPSVRTDHDVLGFHVAVHQPAPVDGGQRSEQVEGEPDHPVDR